MSHCAQQEPPITKLPKHANAQITFHSITVANVQLVQLLNTGTGPPGSAKFVLLAQFITSLLKLVLNVLLISLLKLMESVLLVLLAPSMEVPSFASIVELEQSMMKSPSHA